MRRPKLFMLLFFLFIVIGIAGVFKSGENISLSLSPLFAYVLVILVPGRFLVLDIKQKKQKRQWIVWVITSVTAALVWFKMTNDKTVFLYVIAGILFWVTLALVSINDKAKSLPQLNTRVK